MSGCDGWLAGAVRCGACGHIWIAVRQCPLPYDVHGAARLPSEKLECPRCEQSYGEATSPKLAVPRFTRKHK